MATAVVTQQMASVASHDFETYVNYVKVPEGMDLATNQLLILRMPEIDDPRKVLVRDIRPNLYDYKLDKDGFEIVKMSDEYQLVTEDDELYAKELERYLQDVVELFKEKTGARFVKCCMTMSRPKCLHHRDPDPSVPTPYRNFTIPRVHCDFSPDSVPALWRYLPCMANADQRAIEEWSEAEELLKENPRVAVIGAWKPLATTVKSIPFCWIDHRTVEEMDYLHLPRVVKNGYNGGLSTLKHDAPEEMLLFKHYDSKEDVSCKVPHAGLEKPGTEHLPDRSNVETRVVLIY